MSDNAVRLAVLEERQKKDVEASALALSLQAKIYETQYANLRKDVSTLQRITFVGIGIVLTLQFVLKFLII